MLDFFPFVTEYCYKIESEQQNCASKLKERLEFFPNYEGNVGDYGFLLERKRSLFYRNSFTTTADGGFIKNGSELYFRLTFYMADSVRYFAIFFAIISFIISLVGIFTKTHEVAPFFLYFIGALFGGKLFTYLIEEKSLIEAVEYALDIPQRVKKIPSEIN